MMCGEHSTRAGGPRARLWAWLLLGCVLCACGKRREETPTEATVRYAAPAHRHDHGEPPGPPAPGQGGASGRISASVITISHIDVEKFASRREKPSRSKAEALELARTISAQARQQPARFGELAREHSEDPVAPEGGELGAWEAGKNADIDGIIGGLAVGEISEPLDTEYGYRILQRNTPLPDEPVAARQLIVAWTGATRAPSTVARAKAHALDRAEGIAARARREPAGFEALIMAESDGWDRLRGGHMGTWAMNGGHFPAPFDRAVHSLKVGEISDPVESEFGYHVLQRLAVGGSAAAIAGAHILIAFQGAEKARATVTRSKEEAETEAKRLVEQARAAPDRFGVLAAERSDDVTRKRGGDLGSWRQGSMPAAFDDAMAKLKPGEVGGPVLTQFGYHVLLRREAPTERPYVAE